jgi:hypothetical protein
VAGRIQNLKPWPKGVSGNPGGRPKRDLSSEIARAVFENNPEAIYRAMARALLRGKPETFKVLADRAYGKVKQQLELNDPYQDFDDAQLEEQIQQIQKKLGLIPDPALKAMRLP